MGILRREGRKSHNADEDFLFENPTPGESGETRTRRRGSIKSFSKQAVRPMVEQGLPGQLKDLVGKNCY